MFNARYNHESVVLLTFFNTKKIFNKFSKVDSDQKIKIRVKNKLFKLIFLIIPKIILKCWYYFYFLYDLLLSYFLEPRL